ncbi:dihydropteroate synthase [Aureibacter tunicatorum]|uniref:dihydropteroate synthase n=1 Tax=Aureibacter tunicatorum TaxID=866807 RepID=A0AAE3XMQ6_9BACT|nr:dihydropteroate synthase [Aureibacter tunicatorum]MDR6237844.1 dihydropteroate synthase [Aureibacter tunicatorum]BDD02879.1 dihydropteroate synthase [Aureibacter tunicatorum]
MTKDTVFSTKITLNANGKILDLSQPIVMGILNITPDSFYEGSRISNHDEILAKARQMLIDGASILDIGGYSSRPGADDITIQEEIDRVTGPIEAIASHYPNAIISIDTFRSEVVQAAVEAGAHIINDISGGTIDDKMFDTVAQLRVPYIMMHMKGTPQTMVQLNQYEDLVYDIMDFFTKRINKLKSLGVNDIILDPGFGFAKHIDQNFELLRRLDEFKILELPLLIGVSRKSMIYKTLHIKPAEALNGTTVLNTISLNKGAHILRVHDVKEAMETIKLHKKIYPNEH